MDEDGERRADEIKRRKDRPAAQQRLIDAEARRQGQTRKIQEDFLDRQVAQQHEKEEKKSQNSMKEGHDLGGTSPRLP
jgi:hypothetical protein